MESVRFEVISWYHNFPTNFIPLEINKPTFSAFVLKAVSTKETIGLTFTWGFMIMNNGVTALKYAAKDDCISKDKKVNEIQLIEVQSTVRLSHLRYRKEFDKIKVGFGLQFTIPPYQEVDINYQDLLNLLQL
ncbi:MAG TPA: hypothetical protein VKR53_00940 [Puia sp.]|nr:hypothetical protein [Puia sp.]